MQQQEKQENEQQRGKPIEHDVDQIALHCLLL